MTKFKEPIKIIDFIFEQWDKLGLEFDDELKARVKKASNANLALGDTVLEHINNSISQFQPQEDFPDWLTDIDDFFSEPADIEFQERWGQNRKFKKSSQYSSKYVSVITLLTPIVYFDHIVKLVSFDDIFLNDMELAFISRINVPRDIIEAKRLYSTILSLPKSFNSYFRGKISCSSQPYMAQMMFVVLLMRRAPKGSDIWNFQFECLKSCPDYFFDHPEISLSSNDYTTTYRPAFWMAHDVNNLEFRQIMYQRGRPELLRCLSDVTEFETKRAQATKDLATDLTTENLPLNKRVSLDQAELANLLVEFDDYLAKHYPDVFEKLCPGVNDDQIDKLNHQLSPLKLPADLVTLYKWHNGIEYGSFLFGYPEFSSMESALDDYREALELWVESWCKAWFTLSFEGRVYLLVPMSEEVNMESPVLRYELEIGELSVNHSSIKNMIKTYFEAYQNGVIGFDELGENREEDLVKLTKIRLKNSSNAYAYDYPNQATAIYDLYEPMMWPKEWQKYYIGEMMD